MKKFAVSVLAVAVVAAFVLVFSVDTADARPQYKMEFDKKYMGKDSALAKAYDGKSTYNVCHAGSDRKNRNPLGKAIEKSLGAKNVKETDAIGKALAGAAAAK